MPRSSSLRRNTTRSGGVRASINETHSAYSVLCAAQEKSSGVSPVAAMSGHTSAFNSIAPTTAHSATLSTNLSLGAECRQSPALCFAISPAHRIRTIQRERLPQHGLACPWSRIPASRAFPDSNDRTPTHHLRTSSTAPPALPPDYTPGRLSALSLHLDSAWPASASWPSPCSVSGGIRRRTGACRTGVYRTGSCARLPALWRCGAPPPCTAPALRCGSSGIARTVVRSSHYPLPLEFVHL
ncbi:MAG: hypothetical protein BWX86_00584 [Verrucomicrobia bacterium ADurb.Bin122]|nr:MAG: hypothetical protein BWX86_00584 [Verrucomicrobia bacterium ADurb.Bin122]